MGENVNEKAYKSMKLVGIVNITLGIVMITLTVVSSAFIIASGAKLLKDKTGITF